jgi:hypothetical protein
MLASSDGRPMSCISRSGALLVAVGALAFSGCGVERESAVASSTGSATTTSSVSTRDPSDGDVGAVTPESFLRALALWPTLVAGEIRVVEASKSPVEACEMDGSLVRAEYVDRQNAMPLVLLAPRGGSAVSDLSPGDHRNVVLGAGSEPGGVGVILAERLADGLVASVLLPADSADRIAASFEQTTAWMSEGGQAKAREEMRLSAESAEARTGVSPVDEFVHENQECISEVAALAASIQFAGT